MKQRLWMCTSMLGLGLSALLVGCTGVVGEQPAGSAGSGGGGPGPAPTLAETECVEAASLAPARIWLLSDTQYVNIVRDAFGVSLSGKEREVTTAASKTGIFTNKSEAFKVDLSAAKGYQRTAALVAERLVPSLSTDAAGVQSFIDSRISRAWRRPVTPQESAALMQISMMCPPPSDAERWPWLPGTSQQERDDPNGKAFTGTGPSVDQELLTNVAAFQGTALGSLQLGGSLQSMKGSGPECLRTLSYKDKAQALWPESRPNIAFDNVFGSVLTGADDATKARMAAQGKSVLDFVRGGIDGLKAQVPASQGPKLESHLEAIRSLEMSIGGSGASCVPPVLAPIPEQAGMSEDDAKHKLASEQQMQLIKTAFQCDLTRVVSFTYGFGNSDLRISQFAPDTGITSTKGHHEVSHDTDESVKAAYETFYNQTTAKLLLEMKSVQEGNGMSMLDNTLVVYFSECSRGASHSIPDIPVLLFGGKSLGLNAGSYLQYSEPRTFADLWVETFKALGYDKPQYGDPMWNNGSLSGLYGV